ncbi:hypothetical protein LOZ12_004178 [Ophidiomyces ophidiicola]|uniref:Uncharacterized protein n=1 Tax=Ophidiomyces ophidiicola TaxID=1387563 RepID=A0ACB8URK8_9EURO|nr:uncharacterized protein LOZ57_006289 [Ophidiomyces ophidiicola]KAI1907831.1 hypothetical protein LOZ64_005731 [Ophidiomyces ophidiicola]KAI1937095.1 hypothetical protein LOZ62_005530 [Ophidiomyces ophidiicola]KAI1938743.1 hypothetical protein LOZ57_006289 [Ophidiomyces ophidiicola]KAI1951527.1 hypothetical protein LOZ59_005617 [Ophidiomyces ophidiicola]KAI2004382.1 hypothetical protein LOZ50_004325 [Ophidiomyces ophidiicola]
MDPPKRPHDAYINHYNQGGVVYPDLSWVDQTNLVADNASKPSGLEGDSYAVPTGGMGTLEYPKFQISNDDFSWIDKQVAAFNESGGDGYSQNSLSLVDFGFPGPSDLNNFQSYYARRLQPPIEMAPRETPRDTVMRDFDDRNGNVADPTAQGILPGMEYPKIKNTRNAPSLLPAMFQRDQVQRGHRSPRSIMREQTFAFVANPAIFFQEPTEEHQLPVNKKITIDALPLEILDKIFKKLDGASQVALALTAKSLGQALLCANHEGTIFYSGIEREQLLCWRLAPNFPASFKLCYVCMKYYPINPRWWARRKACGMAKTCSPIYGRHHSDFEFKNVACPECTAEGKWSNVTQAHNALQRALFS